MFCFLGRSSDNYVGIKLDKIRANFFSNIWSLCFYSLQHKKSKISTKILESAFHLENVIIKRENLGTGVPYFKKFQLLREREKCTIPLSFTTRIH